MQGRKKRKGRDNMAKKMEITRQQYKDIKKKDHREMNEFLIRFWQDGYNDGLKAAKKTKISPAEIEQEISEIKGMGEVKTKAVMQKIYKLFEGVEN
jgi:Fic family protein